ncbi:MAG: hydrolase, partial [Vagococcus sp.]
MTHYWQNDQEYISLVEDLIYTDEVQALREFKQHHYTN